MQTSMVWGSMNLNLIKKKNQEDPRKHKSVYVVVSTIKLSCK